MGAKIVNEKSTTEVTDLRAENERLHEQNARIRYLIIDMLEKLEDLERNCNLLLEEKI